MDVIVTCEHARNDVPHRYIELFEGAEEDLDGHRGWDPGSRLLARRLARRLGSAPILGRVSRLVVDLNRSEDHPNLFSARMRGVPPGEREALLDTYYRPHRRAVEEAVRGGIERGRDVLHLGVHTFTPVWRGRARATDIGILHDPRRTWERELALRLKRCLQRELPALAIHLNRPYRGWTDGLTTYLRGRFPHQDARARPGSGIASPPAPRYAGIELEVSQRFHLGPPTPWTDVQAGIVAAVMTTVAGEAHPSRLYCSR
jgi:predicted N-formylglutamate amidohydrolase